MKKTKTKFIRVAESIERDSLIDQGLTAREIEGNAYGEILAWNEPGQKYTPVICGHGGSMWLCRQCADNIKIEKP